MKFYRAVLLIVILSTLPFVSLLRGEFLFDDIEFIQMNSQLKEVKSLLDCFHFQMQPTRPVSNFFMGFGQLLGDGSVAGHRILSILIHALVCLLLFTNLNLLMPRCWPSAPKTFSFWCTALFAIHPLTTESILIGQFRSEMLAVLFSLATLALIQLIQQNPTIRISRKVAIFACVFACSGLAVLSKEVFAASLPILCVLLAISRPSHRESLLFFSVFNGLFWGLILFILSKNDATSYSPHSVAVGTGILEPGLHLRLAASALIDGAHKALLGSNLATYPTLLNRFDFESHIGNLGSCVALCTGALFFLFFARWRDWTRTISVVLLIAVSIYLLIPNTNMGAEHYWYFPLGPWIALLVGMSWEALAKFSNQPAKTWRMVMLAYSLTLGTGLALRLSDLKDRISYSYDLHYRFPKSASVYAELASLWMVQGNFEAAHTYLNKGLKLNPHNFDLLANQFIYFYNTGRRQSAEESIQKLRPFLSKQPRTLARYYGGLAVLDFQERDCRAAAGTFSIALQLDPLNDDIRRVYSLFLDRKNREPGFCRAS
jgi:hypothetical protein